MGKVKKIYTRIALKLTKLKGKKTKKVWINGTIHEFSDELGSCLGSVINKESKLNSKLVVELQAGEEYRIFERILTPNVINSFFSLSGNYAKITNHYKPPTDSSMSQDEIDELNINNYAIDMALNPDLATTAQADKRIVIENLFINGNGSGIRCQGSYGSKIKNVDIYNMENGIDFQFCLQSEIKGCEIHYRNKGILVGIIGTGYNSTQSNLTKIVDNRAFALRPHSSSHRSPQTGLEISDSNLVSVDGFVSEGWTTERGIHLKNTNTTVTSLDIKRFHAENLTYNDSVIVSDGRWLPLLLLDEGYYAPNKNNRANFFRADFTGTSSRVKITNTYAMGYWKFLMNRHANNRNISCGFDFYGLSKQLPNNLAFREMFSDLEPGLGGKKLPEKLYVNGSLLN